MNGTESARRKETARNTLRNSAGREVAWKKRGLLAGGAGGTVESQRETHPVERPRARGKRERARVSAAWWWKYYVLCFLCGPVLSRTSHRTHRAIRLIVVVVVVVTFAAVVVIIVVRYVIVFFVRSFPPIRSIAPRNGLIRCFLTHAEADRKAPEKGFSTQGRFSRCEGAGVSLPEVECDGSPPDNGTDNGACVGERFMSHDWITSEEIQLLNSFMRYLLFPLVNFPKLSISLNGE